MCVCVCVKTHTHTHTHRYDREVRTVDVSKGVVAFAANASSFSIAAAWAGKGGISDKLAQGVCVVSNYQKCLENNRGKKEGKNSLRRNKFSEVSDNKRKKKCLTNNKRKKEQESAS